MARTTWGPLSTDEQNQIEFAPVGEPGVLAPGTTGGLLKRNADGTIGNSILSESGSVLTAAGRLVIGGGTVTASTPVLDLSQTWNLAGTTFTGLKFNVSNSASQSASLFLDFQRDGGSRFSVTRNGVLSTDAAILIPATAASITMGGDVILQRSAAGVLDLRNLANAQTLQVYGTADAGLLNYRRIRTTMTTGGAATIAAEGLGTGVSGNTLVFTVNGSTAISIPASLNTTFGANIYAPAANVFGWVGRNALSAPADAAYLFQNSAGTDADIFLKFGVNTSAAAGIKRVGTELRARLNDDSAFATIQGKLRTDNAYAAGAPGAATGTVTITDSTGTAYRIPVLV